MNPVCKNLLITITLSAITACSTTPYGSSAYSSGRDFVGPTERKVVLGMASANIAAMLGSPSIIADHENNEKTWTYDGISSDVSYARSGNAIVGVTFDRSFDNSVLRNPDTDLQPTLTVVIRFNRYDRVRDFSYFTSR